MAPPHGRPLAGFTATTYGDRFADVYDDWYTDVTDTEACVDRVADLARTATPPGDHPRVLELGVGTGRLAIPLAGSGVAVTGLDASVAMLDALRAKPGGAEVTAVAGDMARPPLSGRRFHAVLLAYNTLFNLVDDGEQERCLAAARALLAPGGVVVLEAFVPDPEATPGDTVATRQVTADRVVLSVSRTDVRTQLVVGQFVDITEAGVKLRPWQVRWASPSELDELADAAGLALVHRWADWDRAPFSPAAASHISVYRSA
jgi:SAM-dependent methyltransferase